MKYQHLEKAQFLQVEYFYGQTALIFEINQHDKKKFVLFLYFRMFKNLAIGFIALDTNKYTKKTN